MVQAESLDPDEKLACFWFWYGSIVHLEGGLCWAYLVKYDCFHIEKQRLRKCHEDKKCETLDSGSNLVMLSMFMSVPDL